MKGLLMTGMICRKRTILYMVGALVTALLFVQEMASAQEEVTSDIRRYKKYEVSTGYYEEFEVLPRHQRPFVGVPGVMRGLFPYSPSASQVRIRTRLADSHRAIKFYKQRRCEGCHVEEAKDIHTTRANLTCRQCHGGEPIASIQHFYSPMNPIRKHAYVCSKCHEGASASYASYVIHEPAPGSSAARKSFPALYYAYWSMLLLLGFTLAFFIPHTLMVGLREFLIIRKRGKAGK
jgi:Zn finger protein HypA/HybF involved in hydrogenase expression